MSQNTVRLHPAAYEALDKLQAELQAGMGIKATYQDIAASLVFGVTAPQAVGMLAAFYKHVSASDTGDDQAAE